MKLICVSRSAVSIYRDRSYSQTHYTKILLHKLSSAFKDFKFHPFEDYCQGKHWLWVDVCRAQMIFLKLLVLAGFAVFYTLLDQLSEIFDAQFQSHNPYSKVHV